MKKFSMLNEAVCVTADKNLGNKLDLGVTNHYTPVENIVTNVKNLFCAMLGIVASVGEDGVSVKLHSSQFVSEKNVYDRLYNVMYNSQSLYSYITQQGLSVVKLVQVGQYYVVYFCPADIKQQQQQMKKQLNNLQNLVKVVLLVQKCYKWV